MKRLSLLVAVISLLQPYQTIKISSVDQSTALLNEARNAIAKSNVLYFKAFAQADSSLFIDRYATDACIMPPNIPALCGKQAAPSFYRLAYEQLGIRNGKFTSQAIYGRGEYVTEQGLFDLFDGHRKLIDHGKYLVLWKKTNTGWKMFRDAFSSDRAVSAAR